MTPTPVKDLRKHVERVQASITDPAERLRALEVVKRDVQDILGVVVTYENDARLQAGESNDGSSRSPDNGSAGPAPPVGGAGSEPG
jgi:hypothetical protein